MKGALLDGDQGETAVPVSYPASLTVYWCGWVGGCCWGRGACGRKGVIKYLFGVFGIFFTPLDALEFSLTQNVLKLT